MAQQWAQLSIGGNAEIISATILSARTGRYGSDIIADTAAHVPPTDHTWCAIQAITATVITTALISPQTPTTGTLNGVTIAAGQTVFIPLVGVTLASGIAILYRDR